MRPRWVEKERKALKTMRRQNFGSHLFPQEGIQVEVGPWIHGSKFQGQELKDIINRPN